jgi:hypothetical protein
MVRLLGILLFVLMVSCKSRHEVGNSYLEAKHHPSEKIAGDQKKAAKKAQRVFVKQQKKNQKSMAKIEAKKKHSH